MFSSCFSSSRAASHFVLFCLSFWFAFVLDSYKFFFLSRRPLPRAALPLHCANKTRTGEQAAHCLPARPPLLALLLACLTALAAFHLSLRRSHSSLSLARRIRSQLQRNQSKERHTSASPSLSSSSQPQNEQNFFVFLWGVSNNFWLIELLIKLIEMQREATSLVNNNNVDWIKYFKAYCTAEAEQAKERARARERA